MRTLLIRKVAIAFLLATTLLIVGCGGSGGGGGASNKNPEILFINGSADGGDLAFFLDDTNFSGPLKYLGRSAAFRRFEYRSEADNGWDLSLRQADNSAVFENLFKIFDRDKSYLGVAFGMKKFVVGEEEKRLTESIIEVDRARPTGNLAKLIVFHGFNRGAGDDTPSVIFQSPGDNPQFSTGNIRYGLTQTITVDSGRSDWVVKRADGEAIYATVSVDLQPSSIYLVMIGGVEGAAAAGERPRATFINIPTD
ncbi:MAG: hypothetical protein KIT11_09240 [Fimbriimonadaceae bacterium]|nr:hypothetical protein [Fimbriimonadaceae bacterium]QYK55512.1 MAG: hypothetical protein KF733_10910 [Fimbriimonadaceae bacterium]